MEQIQYVGRKERKADTLAGTGLVWERGQVHEVQPGPASVLLKYPDVWRRFDGEVLPVAVAAAAAAGGGLADESATLLIPPAATTGPYFMTADGQLIDLMGKPVVFSPLQVPVETVTYSDGTQATGTAPLPPESPAQQDAAVAAAPAPAPAAPPASPAGNAPPQTAAESLRASGIDAAEQVLANMSDEDVRGVGETVGLVLDARNKGQALRVKVLEALFPEAGKE